MSEQATKLLEQVLALPAADREMIAARLSADAPEPYPEVPGEVVTGDEWNAAWHDEIVSRLDAYDRGEVKAVPWREAMDRIEQKLRERQG